tara:strand:+ start:54 stop:404 length:351 start_codon:yes stop_codon:yes gene_type:complete
MTNLDTFTQAYYKAIYFTDTGEDDQPPTDAEIASEAKKDIEADCEAFYLKSGLEALYSKDVIEQAGHDFWLTRNGHGAGFWDGDWAEPMATDLTTISEAFGVVDTYLGDDGLIYTV